MMTGIRQATAQTSMICAGPTLPYFVFTLRKRTTHSTLF